MITRWLRSLVVRVGRRGCYLLFLALLDFVYGWSLLSQTNLIVSHLDLYAPPMVWAIAWLTVGVVCLIESFLTLDRLAFTMAVLIKFLWGITMILSWAANPALAPFGWISGSIFLAFCGLTSVVSFWPEQRRFKIEDR